MPDRTPIIFTLQELWLLQGKVRHDTAHREQWTVPPANQELNTQVAMAILLCEENGVLDACLELSFEDCLLLDYVIPQEAKDSDGHQLGRPVLRKSFLARRRLLGWDLDASADEPLDVQVDVPIMMSLFNSELRQGRKTD